MYLFVLFFFFIIIIFVVCYDMRFGCMLVCMCMFFILSPSRAIEQTKGEREWERKCSHNFPVTILFWLYFFIGRGTIAHFTWKEKRSPLTARTHIYYFVVVMSCIRTSGAPFLSEVTLLGIFLLCVRYLCVFVLFLFPAFLFISWIHVIETKQSPHTKKEIRRRNFSVFLLLVSFSFKFIPIHIGNERMESSTRYLKWHSFAVSFMLFRSFYLFTSTEWVYECLA